MGNEFTEEWFAAYKARRAQQQPEQEGTVMDSMRVKSVPKRTPGERMNKTEARFMAYRLEPMKHAGEIIKYEFEPMNFRVVHGENKNRFYKPDFGLWYPDGSITMIEIKAYKMHRDTVTKLMGIKERYGTPYFQFELWQWKDGTWTQILI
jgi:hypothetical protein